nr:MAG TPA: hypothetical protein [Caudoviricetes sp.]
MEMNYTLGKFLLVFTLITSLRKFWVRIFYAF